MGTDGVIVVQVRGQQSSQMGFVEHNDLVEKLSAQGADQAFRVGILPRRLQGNHHFLNAPISHAMAEVLPIDLIPIPQQIGALRRTEMLRRSAAPFTEP
jgi:hypothetical protein